MRQLRKVIGILLLSAVVGLLVLYFNPDYTETNNLYSNRDYYANRGKAASEDAD